MSHTYDLNRIHTVLSSASVDGIYVWTIACKRDGERRVVVGWYQRSNMSLNPNQTRAMAGIAENGVNGWIWLDESYGMKDAQTRKSIGQLMLQAADLAEKEGAY